jgi:O-antigen ligase
LIAILSFIFIFFENTMYALPIIISMLVIINKSDMTFETSASIGFPLLSVSIFLSSFIFHIIRFKPKFKKGIFFLGLMLISISYMMPLVYLPFDIQSIPLSMVAIVYLGIYVFMSSTMKSNLNYLFKIMMFLNLLLTFQVFFYLYQGYLLHPELDIYHRIFIGWGRNLGWANINDMCFYIALTFPSYLYFIFKKPNTYLLWLLMILPTAAVILSKSRGGIIGYAVVIVGVVLFFLWKGNKKHLTHGLFALLVAALLSYIGREVFYLWYDELILSLGDNLNDFSSNRLYIYENAWKIFLDYPLFGGGWISINTFPFSGRIFMYHSTIFQALAAMGLFGLFALIVHYTQILKYMLKHPTLEKYLFLIGYLASQVHGLIDNVQYSVPYSVLIVLILAMFETSEKQSSFNTIDERYHIIEQK